MDLSMRGMKEMREELNADLLRRIAYLTKGQLMGEILFYIFLLSSIVYLIVGKVYKSIVCITFFKALSTSTNLGAGVSVFVNAP